MDIRKEISKIFKEIYAAPMHGGGTTVSTNQYFPFGYEGFNKEPDYMRIRTARNKYKELLKQFNGDAEKAIENMPPYMLMSL